MKGACRTLALPFPKIIGRPMFRKKEAMQIIGFKATVVGLVYHGENLIVEARNKVTSVIQFVEYDV